MCAASFQMRLLLRSQAYNLGWKLAHVKKVLAKHAPNVRNCVCVCVCCILGVQLQAN